MEKINELIDAYTKAIIAHERNCAQNLDAKETLLQRAEARDTLWNEIDRSIRGTDCIDKTGRQIMEGDLVRYNNAGKHVKEDHWSPIYRVVWKAPGFDLEHFGGGKPTDMDLRFLMQHRQNLLEIIDGEPVDEPEPIEPGSKGTVTTVSRDGIRTEALVQYKSLAANVFREDRPAHIKPPTETVRLEVPANPQHVNRGAFRAITLEEWRDLGGNKHPLCDWHEGVGYVVYDAEALERFNASVEGVNRDRRAVKELLETVPKSFKDDLCETVAKAVDDNIALDITGSQAGLDVIRERARQINEEGYTVVQDDSYDDNELARAAIAYAVGNIGSWPMTWDFEKFKLTDRRRNLVKAAALLIAEIERIDRAKISG